MTRLFTILSLLGAGSLLGGVLILITLCQSDSHLSLLSGWLWLGILLIIPEAVFIGLAIKFSLTEKSRERLSEPCDLRKLY